MSKTFTSRPGITQGRGRGRGTQPRPINPINRPAPAARGTATPARPTGIRMDPGYPSRPGVAGQEYPGQEEQTQAENADIGQRMSYEGCYTKITPNMKKRQQLTAVAARETESYEAHKQQNTPTSFSYVGTAGGGHVTHGEARQKLIQTTPNKTQRLLQNQQRKSFVKVKEEEEIQKKKDEQRQKAALNERRKKEKEEAEATRWDPQMRRTNEAFLNRIEAKNKQAIQGGSRTALKPTQRQTVPREPQEPYTGMSDPGGAYAAQPQHRQPEHRQPEHRQPDYRQPDYRQPSQYDVGSDCAVSGLSSEQMRAVTAVSAVFPNYSTERLVELLETVDFSVDRAIMLLSE